MGFYGNITNVNKSTFQFDKTYPNRWEMDQNAAKDGVFVGRYVLVDYDESSRMASLIDRIEEEYGIDVGDTNFAIGYKRMVYDEANRQWFEETDENNQVILQSSVDPQIEDAHVYVFDPDITENEDTKVCENSVILVIGQVKVSTHAKYPAWDVAHEYAADDKFDYQGKIYKVTSWDGALSGVEYLPTDYPAIFVEQEESNDIVWDSELDLTMPNELYQVVKAVKNVPNYEGVEAWNPGTDVEEYDENNNPIIVHHSVYYSIGDVVYIERNNNKILYKSIADNNDLNPEDGVNWLVEEWPTKIEYFGKFIKLEEVPDSIHPKSLYAANYALDTTKYSNIGRGWDSTVWQKVYRDGDYQYVMIAELNSVVPTFDITTDAPTETPLKPHYDADNSNVYYKLHFQPSWGMRVKSANFNNADNYTLDDRIYPSDVTGKFVVDSHVESSASEDGVNHHSIHKTFVNTPLAVYFDKESFSPYPDKDPKKTVYLDKAGVRHEEVTVDEIKLAPTGYSDNVYYAHATYENGVLVDDGSEIAPTKYPDTYELSVMLPSIGQSISKMWDVVYGTGTEKDALGTYLWDRNSFFFADANTNDWIRNTDTRWNSMAGTRLARLSGAPINRVAAMDNLATVVNSAHDALGMIIRDYDLTNIPVANWDPTKIYYKKPVLENGTYVNGGFFRKGKDYTYTALTGNALTEALAASSYVSLGDPSQTFIDIHDSNIQYYRKSEEKTPIYDPEIENISNERAEALSDKTYINYIKVQPNDPVYEGAEYGSIGLGNIQNLRSDYEAAKYYKISTLPDNSTEAFMLDIGTVPSESSGIYYEITPTAIETETKFYYKDTYFVGIKLDADEAWDRYIQDETTEITVDDFDQFRLCTEATYGELMDSLSEYNESTYRFFSGIQVTPNPSTSEWIEDVTNPVLRRNLPIENLSGQDSIYTINQDGSYTATVYYQLDENEFAINLLTEDPQTDGYLTFTETIPANYISTNETTGVSTYRAPVYACKTSEDEPVNELSGYTLLEILAAQTVEEGGYAYRVSIEDGSFNQVFNLIRKPLPPTYNFDEAEIVTLKAFDFDHFDYYYYLKLLEDAGHEENWFIDTYHKHLYWVKETPASLETAQGKARLEANEYYRLAISDEAIIFYTPEAEAYYLDDGGNYIKETAVRIKPIMQQEIINGQPNPDYRPYYSEASLGFTSANKTVFIPNKYYYCIEENLENYDGPLHYDLAADINHVELFEKNPLYVMESPYDLVPIGSEWNKHVTDIPAGVVLGTRAETWVAKELPEFATNLNTLHGQLLNVNRILEAEDDKTRDARTAQGAINQLNDIISKFDTLIPAEPVMVDAFGRVHSGDWDSRQTVSGTNLGGAAVNITDTTTNGNERWIKMTTDKGSATDYKPHIKLEHTLGHSAANTTTTADKNQHDDLEATVPIEFTGLNKNDSSDSNKDVLQLYTPIIDNMGHVIGKNTETVTLPYGFKIITTNGRNSNNNTTALETQDDIVADSTQDTLGINSGNEWIKIETNSNTDTITISHDVINTTSTTSSLSLSSENDTTVQFTIPTYAFDATNHYASHDTKTLTMPNSYGKFTGDTGNSEATATHDTFSITGDTWVTTTVGKDSISLAHSAAHDAVAITMPAATLANAVEPQFGDKFTLPDWTFDGKGHQKGVATHTVKIPKGSLVVSEGVDSLTNANVLTTIGFTDTTGAITATNKLVGTLPITGYTTQSGIDTMPVATDSINVAFGKLAFILNNETTQVNTRITNAINALDSSYTAANASAGSNITSASTVNAISKVDIVHGLIANGTSASVLVDAAGAAAAAETASKSYADTLISNLRDEISAGFIDNNELVANLAELEVGSGDYWGAQFGSVQEDTNAVFGNGTNGTAVNLDNTTPQKILLSTVQNAYRLGTSTRYSFNTVNSAADGGVTILEDGTYKIFGSVDMRIGNNIRAMITEIYKQSGGGEFTPTGENTSLVVKNMDFYNTGINYYQPVETGSKLVTLHQGDVLYLTTRAIYGTSGTGDANRLYYSPSSQNTYMLVERVGALPNNS